MAAVPIYVWNGSAWQETGPTIPANPIKYQASAPSSPSTGDIWVDSDGDVTTGSQQFQRFRFVASGGETTISGADANGAVLAYTAGLEQVVLNGAVLVRGHDYTATTGTTITGLSPALVASDVLEVFSFIAFTVANTYTQSQVDGLLADYAGLRLIVPTSAVNGTVGATGAVTFSSVASVSLNGVFNSTYDNYQIMIQETASANVIFYWRGRTSGTDNSNSNYDWRTFYNDRTTLAVNTGTDNTSAGQFSDTGSSRSSHILEVMNPFLSQPTQIFSKNYINDGNGYLKYGGSQFDANTSFDGITFYPASGTFTGTIRVYGYKA